MLLIKHVLILLTLLAIAGAAYVSYIAIIPIWFSFVLVIALSIYYFLKEITLRNIFLSLLFPIIYGIGINAIIFVDAKLAVCEADIVCGDNNMLIGFGLLVTLIITVTSSFIVGITGCIFYLKRHTHLQKP